MALVKLEPLCINPAYEVAEVRENVRISLKRHHPRLHHLPEFGKSKLDTPLALAGGGPSIMEHLDELREFKTIMAVGSAHDWLVENGITPRYTILVDAHSEVTASYLRRPCPETSYLVATHCPESVFAALDGFPVTMWHCISDSERKFLEVVEPGFQGLGGGCTSGLRAIGMAAVLGYKNLHMFGYDSCLGASGEGHAYPLVCEEVEKEGMNTARVFQIRIGLDGPGEREYACYGYHVVQAQNFEELLRIYNNIFKCTFHGAGLLSDIYNTMMGQTERREDELRAAS